MPVLYIPYKSRYGFLSPGFTVDSTGNIETDEDLSVSGNISLGGEITASSNVTISGDISSNNLQLSAISIQGNLIKNSITNQDILINVDGTGTIKLQEAVEITGVLTTTDTTDASSTTVASLVVSGGIGITKTLRVGFDSYVNSVRIGRGAGSVATNTVMGSSALNSNISGANNTGIGNNALASTLGSSNTAIGADALQANTTGIQNVSVGYNTLSGILAGTGNISIGYNAGSSLVSGNYNVIIGSATGSTINTTNNNILLSDGAGNIRLRFNSSGTGTFESNVVVTGNVTANDATLNSHLVTKRQLDQTAMAFMMFGGSGGGLSY